METPLAVLKRARKKYRDIYENALKTKDHKKAKEFHTKWNRADNLIVRIETKQ